MSKINIKVLSYNAYMHMKNNINRITQLIKDNDTNSWIYSEFPKDMFLTKKFQIEDFDLEENNNGEDKTIDLNNSIKLYEHLKVLPRYIITDECFWLWLYLEKFYKVTKSLMEINGPSTITDHWMFKQGTRRGLMFGVLSRCYLRVDLTIDESLQNKYELTQWIIENPLRFREYSWRSYSSEKHIVIGAIKGAKKAIDEGIEEKNSYYPQIAKYISAIGSVMLLDVVSENYIKDAVYDKIKELSEIEENE